MRWSSSQQSLIAYTVCHGGFVSSTIKLIVLLLLAGYSDESDACSKRGGVIIIDKFYNPVCVAGPK